MNVHLKNLKKKMTNCQNPAKESKFSQIPQKHDKKNNKIKHY
jgi:hypothetical protein